MFEDPLVPFPEEAPMSHNQKPTEAHPKASPLPHVPRRRLALLPRDEHRGWTDDMSERRATSDGRPGHTRWRNDWRFRCPETCRNLSVRKTNWIKSISQPMAGPCQAGFVLPEAHWKVATMSDPIHGTKRNLIEPTNPNAHHFAQTQENT